MEQMSTTRQIPLGCCNPECIELISYELFQELVATAKANGQTVREDEESRERIVEITIKATVVADA